MNNSGDEVEQPTATEDDAEPTTTTGTFEEDRSSSSSTEPAKREPSRNVTFVEVDIVEHVPAKLPSFFEDEDNNATVVKIETKKVYNDTLKAFVIENLPTMGPVKSNTGVGRPIRPRPKLDLLRLATNASIVGQNDSNNNVLIQKKTVGTNGTSVQQIIEVVTSISTKVSADTSDDQVILKLVVANSTAKPAVESRIHKSNKHAAFDVKLNDDKGSAYERSNSSNTRKIAAHQSNNLVDRLKEIANVKVSNVIE